MKFSGILFAVFGLSSLVSALPAPAPLAVADAGLEYLEKRSLIEREPVPVPHTNGNGGSGGTTVNLIADVQVCIDAVVQINKKYTKRFTRDSCKSWAVEIVAQINILISVIKAYPENCVYPAHDACVAIFVKLFVCIFVQLQLICGSIGGLLAGILLTVDILLGVLLGLVGNLLSCILTLCVLIEAKIKVGICGAILSGCNGLIGGLYLNVIINLCLGAGISL